MGGRAEEGWLFTGGVSFVVALGRVFYGDL